MKTRIADLNNARFSAVIGSTLKHGVFQALKVVSMYGVRLYYCPGRSGENVIATNIERRIDMALKPLDKIPELRERPPPSLVSSKIIRAFGETLRVNVRCISLGR